jgi:hypothetical protein
MTIAIHFLYTLLPLKMNAACAVNQACNFYFPPAPELSPRSWR